MTGDDLAFDDSELIEPGDSFILTFDELGTYRYAGGPHPGMGGLLTVSLAPGSTRRAHDNQGVGARFRAPNLAGAAEHLAHPGIRIR